MITRYEMPRITEIWSRANQLRLWRTVELAWLHEVCPSAHSAAANVFCPTPEEVELAENATRHEFTAFLSAWVGRFGSNEAGRRWVHFGLTSSDVIDTALALQMVLSQEVIDNALVRLINVLEAEITDLEQVEQVGRTHGQWAQPRPAANPLLVLVSMLRRQRERGQRAAEDLEMGQFTGPTGVSGSIDQQAAHRALRSLGLRRAPVTTQIIPRDSMVHWAHVLTNTVTVCEAIADHYWFLSQSEIAEVTPGGWAGSSAMPHKRNPAMAENLRGIGRLARALVSALDESIVQRGDRDLAHSSAERVALPDLLHLVAWAVEGATRIVQTYTFEPNSMLANLAVAESHGARSAETVTSHVLAGHSREAAMKMENPHV